MKIESADVSDIAVREKLAEMSSHLSNFTQNIAGKLEQEVWR